MPKDEVTQFSHTVGIAFCLLGTLLLWRERSLGWLLLLAGVVLFLTGLLAPAALQPVYRAWMGVARLLGEIMSRLILAIVYYVIVMPIGILAKIARKKFLSTNIDTAAPTYWQPREKKDGNYERQF
ncbi:MAG TPA: SxtJ family membrane protein [Candidatus Andersenbacteria bacterium]|nr:MAG: hypothetical protein A2854_04610 [Parcubacteria group bacterium RIFCSPHIGHO2_01_FULL_56_18]HLD25603.1 SxtJ family membrane protein [Candidatus Andersenbacteria bacterium]